MKVFIHEMFINVLLIVLIDQLVVYQVANLIFLNVFLMIIIGHLGQKLSYEEKNISIIYFYFLDLLEKK